jgi:hypothetical protein
VLIFDLALRQFSYRPVKNSPADWFPRDGSGVCCTTWDDHLFYAILSTLEVYDVQESCRQKALWLLDVASCEWRQLTKEEPKGESDIRWPFGDAQAQIAKVMSNGCLSAFLEIIVLIFTGWLHLCTRRIFNLRTFSISQLPTQPITLRNLALMGCCKLSWVPQSDELRFSTPNFQLLSMLLKW